MHDYERLVRVLDESAKTGDYDAMRTVLAPDVHAWSPTYDLRTADALVDAIRAQNDAATDISTELTIDVVAHEGKVFWESVWTGTYPALGKTVTLRALSVGEVEEGKLARIRQYWDNLAVMGALGLTG